MNFENYIARRISFYKENKKKLSYRVIRIAISAVALAVAVMLITISVVTGFKKEIYNKVIGFQSHITIKNRDINSTFETMPVGRTNQIVEDLKSNSDIRHIQVYATKPGIIKSDDEVQGVVLKGIDKDFDWSFMKNYIVKGNAFTVSDEMSKDIIISERLARLLNYKIGDKVNIFFLNKKPKGRAFTLKAIYNTGIEEFDKAFVFCDIKQIVKLNEWNDDQISGFEVFIKDFKKLDEKSLDIKLQASSYINNDGSMLLVTNFYENNEMLVEWLKLSDTNAVVILTLMIIVAVLTMISALLTIILERTSTIGILKAIGASDSSVMKIFIYNGAFIIAKAMFLGNFFALLLLALQKQFKLFPLDPEIYYIDSVPVNFDPQNIIFLNLAILAVSVFSLILPALLVARISTAETVKFK